MGGFDRKAADLVSAWDRFLVRECGFYPPKLAALALNQTTQGIYSAADRGVFRYVTLGVSRFYSRADVSRERERRVRRILDAAVTPLDRHLQSVSGYQAKMPDLPVLDPALGAWHEFLASHDGAYPSKVAGCRLRISTQGVWLAHRAGWIRSFLVGRENFFSRRDVEDYWHQAARKNPSSRPLPRFKSAAIAGKC